MTVAIVHGAAKPTGRRLRQVVTVIGAVVLVVLVWSVWDHEAIVAWMRQLNPVWFFAATALLPIIGAPITPFFVLAGATFGITIGLLGSGAALAANLAICYWLARSGLRPRIEGFLRRFQYKLPSFHEKRGAFRFTMIVKLAPGVPAFVKNYALGVARVPFLLYFVASMLITGTYATLMVVVGESLLDHDLRMLAVVAAVVVVLGGGVWWWRKRRKRVPSTHAAQPA